jgi:hypothetical protein
MIAHRRFELLALASLDFALTAAEAAELDGHLATCAGCRSRVTAYRRDDAGLRAMAVVHAPARVRAAVVSAAERRRTRPSGWRLLAVAAALALLAIGALLGAAALLQRSDPVEVLLPAVLDTGRARLAGVVPVDDGWLIVANSDAGTRLQRSDLRTGWIPDDAGDSLEFAHSSAIVPLESGEIVVVGQLQQRGVTFVRSGGSWTRSDALASVLPDHVAAVDATVWVVGWNQHRLADGLVVLAGAAAGPFEEIAVDLPFVRAGARIAAGDERIAIAGCDPDAPDCALRIVTLADDGSDLHTATLPAAVVLSLDDLQIVADGTGFVVVVLAADGAVHVWRSEDGRVFRSLEALPSGAFSDPPVLARSARGLVAVGIVDGNITVWRLDGAPGGTPWSTGLPMSTVHAVAASGDRLFVLGELDSTPRGWIVVQPEDA